MAKAQPIIVLFLCFVLFELAFAQVNPDVRQPSNSQQQPQGQQSRGILVLSGTVIYDDGSPADMTAQVKLVCDGRVRRRGNIFNGNYK